MTDSTSNADPEVIKPLQQRVQQRLGRCILRLQQYERLLKALVGAADIRGKPHELETARKRSLEAAQRSTLGLLVGAFTSTVLKPEEQAWPDDDSDPTEFRAQHVVELPSDHLGALRDSLKSLVALRNNLVHHFIEHFDIWTPQGCQAAESHLDSSFEIINRHFEELADIAKAMDASREEMLAFINSQAFSDVFFDGIHPDGRVEWPRAGIVQVLREAEAHLQCDGWTDLNQAIAWIRQCHPKQHPSRYGCSSWRHVVHMSQAFEVRRHSDENLQETRTFYRSMHR